jgi:glycine cleavage system H lipoate-binding protein
MKEFLPCIWMQAGVLDYRLCDRAYDCSTCALDHVLRGRPARPLPERMATAGRAGETAGTHVSSGLFYDRRHAWVRIEGGGRARVGLDDFGRRLLGSIRSVALPRPGEQVSARSTSWRVTHDAGELALTIPVEGTVMAVNSRLAEDPSGIEKDPYGEGAAFEVEPLNLAQSLKSLLYGEAALEWHQEESDRLARVLRACAQASHLGGRPDVGPTLNDGGLPVVDPWTVLEPEVIQRIVTLFLGDPAARTGGAAPSPESSAE